MTEATQEPFYGSATPPGVIAILSRPDGYEPVVATHFGRSGPGGFKLKEAQQYYARENLKRKLVETFCGWPIAPAIMNYEAGIIMDNLINKHGWKLTYEYIGHPDEASG